MSEWTFYPARESPAALDIVWCRFPRIEDRNNPGPKPRPALVRKVLNKGGNFYVEVAFGTSNPKRYSDHDLFIGNLAAMNDFGLPQATIFLLDRTAVLPWAKEWFTKMDGDRGPVIGHLNELYKGYLAQIMRR